MQGLSLRQMIDMPPLWLLLFVALARVQAVRLPFATLDHPLADLAGGLLVGGGLVLAAVAVVQMRQSRTTVIPHQEASALVTVGVYARSRNPIYLADAMILAGLVLYWGNWPALVLVPVLMAVLTDRFIRPEEERLRAAFGPAFDTWAQRTRRWL